ncbi:MAG TPA: hypothetical protein VGE12_13880 [Noviherbaspirillum sp.]
MTQEQVIEMFRQHAGKIALEAQGTMLGNVIQDLARLLADSRGRLPKEAFEALIRIGGVLYREGSSQFHARSDVDDIMKSSGRKQGG